LRAQARVTRRNEDKHCKCAIDFPGSPNSLPGYF